MRNRSRILSTLVATIVVGVFACLILKPREPRYNGKSLTEWLAQSEASLAHSDETYQLSPEWIEASNSVRHIGTNGIPTLLRMLQREDPPLKLKLIAFAEKHGLLTMESAAITYSTNSQKYHYVTDGRTHAWAGAGFRFLGPLASNAVPDLLGFYRTTTNDDSRYFALIAIGNIGPPAADALPVMLAAAGSTNRLIQGAGLWSLGMIHAQPDVVIPVLVSKLTNGAEDFRTRISAAYALGLFGAKAKSTSPFLVEMVQDPQLLDPQHVLSQDRTRLVKKYIEGALTAIDPETATKVIDGKKDTPK